MVRKNNSYWGYWLPLFGLMGLFASASFAYSGEEKSTNTWYSETRELYYGLPIQVTYYPENASLNQVIWSYLEDVNLIFNDYKTDSEISRINLRTDSGSIQLSEALADGFAKAVKAYDFSEGAFDVSCAPIRKLWREAEKKGTTPALEAIVATQKTCGLNKIELDGDELTTLAPGIQFDFGGIVKGIAADRVIALLKEGGATSALVQIGGETAAFGPSKKARPYRIAIQHPLDPYGAWCVMHNPKGPLSGSTSGNYENPITIKGKKFYHIFDPRTGKPAPTQVVSVSVIFPNNGTNWLTDSLTTAGVLLGPEKTLALVKKFDGEALFIIQDENGLREIKTEGWDSYQL